MTLINAPIAERRKWVFETAVGLYNLQKARFGYISAGQAREKKLAWKLVKLAKGSEYLIEISKAIADFDMNDIANLNSYWKILLDAQEDADFSRLITEGSFPKPVSKIVLTNTYIEPVMNNVDQEQAESVVKRYATARKLGKILKSSEFLEEFSRYASGFGSFIMYNTLLQHGFHTLDNKMVNTQTVPCVLAGLPLRHVQEIEIARSGKILKFRATGSVFLANQEGGEDAVRVEGILVRSEVIFILTLWMIFYYGQGRVKELNNLTETIGNPALIALRAKNVDITTFNKTLQKPAYTHHFTVPFVTRHIIIPNTYIETLSFEEKVVFGKGVIGYTILLRTYRKVREFEVYSHSPEMSFLSPKVNKSLASFKMLEFFANMAWRFINAESILLDNREWKIGGDDAESDDVYYNISASDLASTAVMGLIGLM